MHAAIPPGPARRLGREEGTGCSPVQAFPSLDSLLRAQKRVGQCCRMSFPAPTSKRGKDMRCQEINGRAAATAAQNVRRDCADGEQNHLSFFILGHPTCFPQPTQKIVCHFAAKAEKERQEPVFPPSSLQPALSSPCCLKKKGAGCGCSAASCPLHGEMLACHARRYMPHCRAHRDPPRASPLLSPSWLQWCQCHQ